MELKEAKEKMKDCREQIKKLKKERMVISDLISNKEQEIRAIKGAIFRGEIK